MAPSPPPQPLRDYADSLRVAVADLWYPSETDAPLTVVIWWVERLNQEGVAHQLGCEVGSVQQLPAADFFRPIFHNAFWRSPQANHLAQRYEALQSLLYNALTDLHTYRIGTLEVDLYLIGRHPSGGYVGLQTMVVET